MCKFKISDISVILCTDGKSVKENSLRILYQEKDGWCVSCVTYMWRKAELYYVMRVTPPLVGHVLLVHMRPVIHACETACITHMCLSNTHMVCVVGTYFILSMWMFCFHTIANCFASFHMTDRFHTICLYTFYHAYNYYM